MTTQKPPQTRPEWAEVLLSERGGRLFWFVRRQEEAPPIIETTGYTVKENEEEDD